jgi:DNA primase
MSILAQNNIIETPFTTDSEDILLEERQSKFDQVSEFLNRSKFLIDSETDAYLLDRAKQNEGMYELFDITKEEIDKTLRHNKFWEIFERERKRENEERKKAYDNRFKIPIGKTKKEYKELFRATTDTIQELDDKWKKDNDNLWLDEEINHYVEKRKKLKLVIETPDSQNFGNEIVRAKAYPIENIIEFNRAGFARCINHQEKTESLKWYPKQNKAHCFGACCKSFDSIDAYMIIHKCSLSVALKNLK